MNLYEQFDKKIQQLIQDDKKFELVHLLKDELNTSYVPEPFYSKWTNLLKKLSVELNQTKQKEEEKQYFNNLKKSDLINNILKDKKINLSFLNIYLNKFKNIDCEEDIEIFQLILNRKDIKQDEKFELLKFLIMNSKHNYQFYNAIINKKELINDQFLKKYNEQIKEMKNIINFEVNKDISIQNLSYQLLNLINLYYFPSTIQKELKINDKMLAKMIIEQINNQFYINKKQTNKIIEKILKYFN
ncbi:MAG: DUF3196 family protein [Mycoplasmataceae bacterium]|nr:DUF3196 family protein [Mycoplasmataceae bacterium]